MRLLRRTLTLIFLVSACFVCQHWPAQAEEPADTSQSPRTLAEMAAHLKAIDNFSTVSMEARRDLIKQIEASFNAAIGADGKGLKPEDMESLLKCAGSLSSCDLGDRPVQYILCQRMTLVGLALADQIKEHQEISLVFLLNVNPKANLNAQGQPMAGTEWQARQRQLLEHLLRPYRRSSQVIDPTWHPIEDSYGLPPNLGGKYLPGTAPESIREPELRARYVAALAEYKKKLERYNEQSGARRKLEHYEFYLKKLSYLYYSQQVTRADIEYLEAELRAAKVEEKLREKLLEESVCATKSIVEQLSEEKPSPPEVSPYDLFRPDLDEIKKLVESSDEQAVAERLDQLREKLQASQHGPRAWLAVASQAIYLFAHTPVRESERVRASTGRLGLAALQATSLTKMSELRLFESQLHLAMYSLSHSNLKPEQIIAEALVAWEPFSAALAHFGPFDSKLPPEQQLKLPPPPEGFADWFSVGQSDANKHDAELQKRYVEVFTLRMERIRNSGRAQELAELNEKVYPQLKNLLRALYAGSHEREQAGAAAIVEHISLESVREQLIDALMAASINRDRMDEWDRRDDEFGPPGSVPSSHAKPNPGEPQLTVDAPPGAVVIRGATGDGAVKFVGELAKLFSVKDPQQAQVDVAEDEFASFARLCDEDLPYHAVIVTSDQAYYDRSDYDRRCEEARQKLGTDSWHASETFLGQRRLLVIVNKANPLESIIFAYIARAFGPDGPAARWQDVGGVGNEIPQAYGHPRDHWASLFLQQTCMIRVRPDPDQPRVSGKRKLPFREDLVACETSREVLDRVSKDPNSIGFLAWDAQFTSEDYKRVKVLAIARQTEPAQAPKLEPVVEPHGILAQSVYLFSGSDRPERVRQFFRFISSPEGEALALQQGLVRKWPKMPEFEHGMVLER